MQSAFNPPDTKIIATTKPYIDESYDLRGLNLVLPDQITNDGDSPYAINCRRYARDDGETRVAIRTRKGSSKLTSAYGETLDAQNVGVSTGDLGFTTTRIVAQPFTAGANGALTKLAPEIKSDTTSRGHVIAMICDDDSGVPGNVIASSSILSSLITTTYAYIDTNFIDAPSLVNGTQYWTLFTIQDNGGGTYYIRQTADVGAVDLESTDATASWSSLGVSFRFKSYLSIAKGVKGFHRRYPSDGSDRTLFAAYGSLYSAEDGGTVTEIDTSIATSSSFVRFAEVDDKTMWVDGISAPRWWDGTTVSNIPNAPTAASLVKIHRGRAFFLIDKTLFRFSALQDFTSYPSVNLFYVPSPKSADAVTGARTFQDNFVIFTHKTKHTVYGAEISSFTYQEAIGTKGAASDEAIAIDMNYCYFMSDDGSVNAWDGGGDTLLSDKMEPEFNAIPDKSKVRFHLYRNQLRVYYASATSTHNDRMAILDLTYSDFKKGDFQWLMDTGRPVVGSLEWTQDNNELIEFSALTPQVFRGEQGYSDVGKAIDFKYWTKYKLYGSGASKKRVKSFRPIVRTVASDYTLLVGKDIDFANDPDMRAYIVSGGGAKWGGFVWGDGTKYGKVPLVDRKSAMSGRGKYIQYRFERSGVETPVELYGYISQVKIGRPK